MSYEATYSSELNTRLVRQAILDVPKGIIAISNSLRITCDEGLQRMNSFMNKTVDTDYTIEKTYLTTHNMRTTVNKNVGIVLNNRLKNVSSSSVKSVVSDLSDSQKNIVLKNYKVEDVNQELIKQTFVDVETVLAIQAITKCGWEIVASNYETTSQTIRAQNNEGTVLAVSIQPEKIMLDISGLSDSSCKNNIQNVIAELNKLGIEFILESENDHRRKKGGTLLSFGDNPALINKAAKMKESLKKKKNLSFQTINIHNPANEIKNSQENKNRERN